jgi:hypothetical protein
VVEALANIFINKLGGLTIQINEEFEVIVGM